MKTELNALIKENGLNSKQSYEFVNKSFTNGYVEELGEDRKSIA